MDDKLYAKSLMTFDHTYEPQMEMYDKLPYARDINVCDWKKPRMASGNIVKFFQYELGKKQIIQNDFEIEPENLSSGETESADNEASNAEASDAPLSDEDLGALLTEELPNDTQLEEELAGLSDTLQEDNEMSENE
ncbi:MAG: hypothetical protein J6I65_03115 [Lachnospiraceae bacterium]|nr:hypothetical protein [Lachnospiraceae bacterium]